MGYVLFHTSMGYVFVHICTLLTFIFSNITYFFHLFIFRYLCTIVIYLFIYIYTYIFNVVKPRNTTIFLKKIILKILAWFLLDLLEDFCKKIAKVYVNCADTNSMGNFSAYASKALNLKSLSRGKKYTLFTKHDSGERIVRICNLELRSWSPGATCTRVRVLNTDKATFSEFKTDNYLETWYVLNYL